MWKITGKEMETSGMEYRRTKGSEEGGRAKTKERQTAFSLPRDKDSFRLRADSGITLFTHTLLTRVNLSPGL